MTIFDTDTDRYLERLGASPSGGDWNDVMRRARSAQRHGRLVRAAAVGGAAATTMAFALAAVGVVGGVSGTSIVDKAEAAVLSPIRAAPGTIVHVLVEYRPASGEPFIEYETWLATDGAWCRRTMEGTPGQTVADTSLTQCRSSEGRLEVYLASTNELLRTGPGAATGASQATQAAAALRFDPGASPDWLTEDVIAAFRRDAVKEAGTMTLDGREYTKLVTEDGRNTVLVDPDTGQGVAWIPTSGAFGVPTTVVRTRRTLPDTARMRRNLSLTELHPDAIVRDVTADELSRAIASQFPRG